MSEPVGREEMNARLEAAEARTEMRFVQLDAKLDVLVGKMGALEGRVVEVLTDNKSTRQTIMWVPITAMLTVIAVVIAVQVGLMNAFSAGAAGRETVPTAAAAVSSQPIGSAPASPPHENHAAPPATANTSG